MDAIVHWRKQAEGHLESAAVLFRKKRFAQMLHHCYFAVQSALEASLARNATTGPDTVSLVVMAEALERDWGAAEQELLITLTDCARSQVDDDGPFDTLSWTKEDCMRILTQAAHIVADLR